MTGTNQTGICSNEGCGRSCDPSTFKVEGNIVGPFCNGCWEYIRKCDACGKFKNTHEMQRGTDRTYFCNRCLAKPTVRCPKCKRHAVGQLCSNGVCVRCNAGMYKCEVCEEYHPAESNFWNSKENQLEYHEIFKETSGGICNKCAGLVIDGVEKNEIGTCQCGELTLDYFVDNGTKTFTCGKCLANLKICAFCGKIHTNRTSIGGKNFCSTCLKSKFYYCTSCNKLHTKSSQQDKNFDLLEVPVLVGNTSVEAITCCVCLPKMGKCDRCKRVLHKSHLYQIGDKWLCGGCGETAGVCSKCSKFTYYKTRVAGCDCCRKCAGEMGRGSILNYSHTPPPTFHGSGKLFLGFENETSFSDDDYIISGVAYVYSKFEEDELIIKSDSSINTGFEIVSHPFDFEEIKKRSWQDLFPPKCRKHSSCGMHIHMSKDAFTTFHLFKFLEFINFNPNFIRTIAGRDENHYSQALSKTTDIAKRKQTNTRYSKVNLNKKDTVELRFFSHAVSEEVFLKNIEFAQALYEFSRDNTPKVSKQITKFFEYVKSNITRFNNLGTFLGMTKVNTKGVELSV